MKTVKFKDLPEKVQQFLIRSFGFKRNAENDVLTNWLHTCPEWSKATDEERLAYAEWKYKKATKFIPVIPNVYRDKVSTVGVISLFPEGIASNKNWLYYENKWAEIISEPEKEKISMEEYEEQLANKFIKEEQPEFKAGDKVVVNYGSTVYKVIHVFDGIAWIKNADQNYGSLVRLSDLRKPDPDKVYREMAKEIMNNNSLNIAKFAGWDGATYHEFNVEFLQDILIEALKKGKEL